MDEKDTVTEVTETDPVQPLGTAVDEPTTVTEPVKDQETIDKAAYEAALEKAAKADELQKELNKREQELNLRRNKEKEAELERLEAEGKHKERAEKLQAELDEIRERQEAAEREKEATDLRNKILSEYPDVKDVAESLNLWWDNPSDYAEAEAQLKTKLDALQAKISGTKPVEGPQPEILANNPSVPTADPEIAQLKSMKADELRKILPVAEPR